MAFFNNYEEVSKQFVAQYYQIFDDPNLRPTLANFYQVSSCEKVNKFYLKILNHSDWTCLNVKTHF